MFRVYRSVYKTEAKSKRWGFRGSMMRNVNVANKPQRSPLSEGVRTQSLFYACSFFTVWTFPTIARLIPLFGGSVSNTLVVLSGTFICSQGIWNAMIYFRPRYKKCKEKGFFRKVWILVKSTLFPYCFDKDYTKDSADYVVEGLPESSEAQKTDSQIRSSLQSVIVIEADVEDINGVVHSSEEKIDCDGIECT